MLHEIAIAEFEALIGQSLRLSDGDTSVNVEVREVRLLHSPSPRPLPPFTLVLRDHDRTRALQQGVYRLDHPTRGELQLFMVPIGPDSGGFCYEVVFN